MSPSSLSVPVQAFNVRPDESGNLLRKSNVECQPSAAPNLISFGDRADTEPSPRRYEHRQDPNPGPALGVRRHDDRSISAKDADDQMAGGRIVRRPGVIARNWKYAGALGVLPDDRDVARRRGKYCPRARRDDSVELLDPLYRISMPRIETSGQESGLIRHGARDGRRLNDIRRELAKVPLPAKRRAESPQNAEREAGRNLGEEPAIAAQSGSEIGSEGEGRRRERVHAKPRRSALKGRSRDKALKGLLAPSPRGRGLG